ncbi:hypothetical protein NLU13_6432 [Sarocladium strictum]|uniref:Uncharacterized protein n=1 Tax=Sarocladium strictum TaxID=5046 RepID=A0AA39L751_SARSR|nr:hypothetical protein NLU13_6432 [Sarocladium strictum]
MKTAPPLWPAIALALAPAVLAQGLRQATGGSGTATYTHQWYPEPSEEVSDCEAKLISTLCDYKEPLSGTAVASSGKKSCWEYCNKNPPCNFVIFVAGNPYTGSGTCWVYPGEEFDEGAGEPGCDALSVFDKPVCAGNATPTSGGCEATASPSALAEICGYPTPDEGCFSSCAASGGASSCMSQCVEADSCSYAIFNPHNGNNPPYYPGTCWMYPSGKFDESKAKTCKGEPEQFVYENPCPQPRPSSSAPSAASRTSSSGGDNDSSRPPKSSEAGSDQNSATEGQDSSKKGEDDDNSSTMVGVSPSGLITLGLTILMWQNF